jgi:hypothetical protein
MTIDGNSANNAGQADQGVVFLGADNSHIYNVYLQNFTNNCVDLRDGDNNLVNDNWGVDCGATPNQWHAFGGGVQKPTGLFRRNKYTNNHASGGAGDHYDIFGQGQSGQGGAVCEENAFIGNTSDTSATEGIFLDTCAKTTLTGNVIESPGAHGIAVTTGVGTQSAAFNTIESNVIVSPAQNGVFLGNVASNNNVVGNHIFNPGQEGILCSNCGGSELITSNFIYLPGQSAASTYSGITLSATAGNTAAHSKIEGNFLTDDTSSGPPNLKMLYGIEIKGAGVLFDNTVDNNQILGGAAGSTGQGVNDAGSATKVFGNTFN